MKKAFSTRRVPRKIGEDDDEHTARDVQIEGSEPTLVRPSSKPRKASSLRTSFDPGVDRDEDTPSAGVITPKRSNISRVAIQRNASKRSALLGAGVPRRQSDEGEERPSYSAAYLQELKESTPTTPRDLTTDASNSDVEDVANDTQALDISSKFGPSLSRYQQPSAIPSAAEIAEKKARRARLAKEQAAEEFITLNPSDPELDEDDDDNVTRDEFGRLVLKPKDKYKEAESRLVRDDEDIMENFEEFTEADRQISFSRKAEHEAAKKRKSEMAAQIAEAEGASDIDSDESERERNEAFEAAQTKHGTYGSYETPNDPYAAVRPKTPPKISPLPTLDGVIERLRRQVAELQTSRMQKLQEMEALQREKIRLGEEEVRIQRALKETADKFQQLRTERGIASSNEQISASAALDPSGLAARLGAGFGAGVDSGANSDTEGINGGRLGLGMAGRGLESLGTSGIGTPMDIDSDGSGEEGAT